MVGWHHRLDGPGCGGTAGVGDGQESVVYCGSWGRKESDTTEQLNWLKGASADQVLQTLRNNSKPPFQDRTSLRGNFQEKSQN